MGSGRGGQTAVVCQGSEQRKGCAGLGFRPNPQAPCLFRRKALQRLRSVAQAVWVGVGCRAVQCFTTSIGLALSGRSVGGAVQGAPTSGRMRRLRITITPPQAQRQTGRDTSGAACA